MIEPGNRDLSIGKQCKLLSIPRSSFYYRPKGETALNLALMRQIDEQFLETPFFGVRQMTWHLRNEGHLVNEKRIRRLMRLMGVTSSFPNGFKLRRAAKMRCPDPQRNAMPMQTPARKAALQISRWRFDRPQDARGPRTHSRGTTAALD